MKALVLCSGGIDSSTALGMAVRKFGHENVIGLSMSYGQKHIRELESARAVARYYDIELISMDLSRIFEYSDSSLLSHSDEEIPKESYAKQLAEADKDETVSTYVPFRNGLFLSTAASIALSKGCTYIYYGAHKDDAAVAAYPDCSKEFNDAIKEAIWEGSGHGLKVEAPFINMNKAQIVKKGLELEVPYELTWSCYEGGDKPCGKCGTCIDRAKAFEANGITDPIIQ